MSTISLSYPTVNRTRRAPVLGIILVLSILAALAIVILVILVSGSTADLPGRAADIQNVIAPIAVPVPAGSNVEIQPVPTETPIPLAGLASGPSVIPVPVQTPPAQ